MQEHQSLNDFDLRNLKHRVDQLERYRFRWRNRWLRFVRTRVGDFLVWNPVFKWSVRMLPSRTGRERKIIPTLNGKECGKHYLLDACGLVSFCGFGFLWGFELDKDQNGNLCGKIKKNRAEGESILFPAWRFGRIRITHHNKD